MCYYIVIVAMTLPILEQKGRLKPWRDAKRFKEQIKSGFVTYLEVLVRGAAHPSEE